MWMGVMVVLLVGLTLLHVNFRLGTKLIRASYDWNFDLSPFRTAHLEDSGVVIVYMDEKSHQDLDQPNNRPWDRGLHATLIDRLGADGAKAIIFDILFTDEGPSPDADRALATAIQKNGRVILGADHSISRPAGLEQGIGTVQPVTLPHRPFEKAAFGWGIVQLHCDEDFIVREHYHGPPDQHIPTLSWTAGELLGIDITRSSSERLKERWINYYGRPGVIPNMSYSHVFETTPGYFKDKIVIVGAKATPGPTGERRDEYRSPYLTWDRDFLFMPAVSVHATTLLNLIRQDWIRRLPPAAESTAIFMAAILFGIGLTRFRPTVAALLALGGMIGTVVVTLYLFNVHRLWFPWMVIVVVQIPLALGWALIGKTIEWYVQKRLLEEARRKAETRIREQAALLDKAQDAIIVRDLSGNVSFWNKSAERLFGTSDQEALCKPLESALAAVKPEMLAEAAKEVLRNGEWTGELKYKDAAGNELVIESRWTLVRSAQGRPESILSISTDVTERRKLEAQLLRTQRMESIGTLAGGIAHDLNNVVAPILMSVEILKMKPADARTEKMFNTIESSAKRGAGLVRQVLTFARGQEGEKVVLQIKHLVKEMEKIVEETFPKSTRIRSRVPTDLWPILGDATQVHQILLNLCVNARDAMPEGGTITMVAENRVLDEEACKSTLGSKPGRYVLLTVTDTGTGIPPEIIERIFEPFFTTKGVGKGTGLGLSTVVGIIKSHNGFLDLHSKVGQGTTFSVYLPAADALSVEGTVNEPTKLLASGTEKILVVDDEEAIRETISAILVSRGYQALTASHGAEALSIFSEKQDEISAVIIDMAMPVMDGPATIKALRKLDPRVPILIVSGLVQAEQAAEISDVKIVNKPFSSEQLLQALQAESDSKKALRLPESQRGTLATAA